MKIAAWCPKCGLPVVFNVEFGTCATVMDVVGEQYLGLSVKPESVRHDCPPEGPKP